MIFFERKRLHRIAIWLFVFAVLPILGFIIYILLGVGVINKRKKILETSLNNSLNKINLKNNFKNVKNFSFNNSIIFNILNNNSLLLDNKNVEIFFNGQTTLNNMKKDIVNAKESIYLLSYIFADDIIGTEIKNLLIKKAKEGVKIIVVYDSLGSKKTSKKFFKELKKFGIEVYSFFPSFLKLFQFSINYRNHRKILIIDDFISYIGGVNIRDDHMGRNKNLAPWRDTHLKIEGKSTLEVLKVFLNDLKLCKTKKIKREIVPFKNFKNSNQNLIQIVSSGPLSKGENLEESYINLINFSKREIIIETPYLILDDKFFNALKLARLRGVDIKILIPKLIDKNFVYNASLYNAKKLLEIGINIYKFNGFLHSKTMLIDRSVFVCGSCNFDMRSFYLNFETSAICYDEDLSKKFYNQLLLDINSSVIMENNFYKKLPLLKRMAISFCSVFSPIL